MFNVGIISIIVWNCQTRSKTYLRYKHGDINTDAGSETHSNRCSMNDFHAVLDGRTCGRVHFGRFG